MQNRVLKLDVDEDGFLWHPEDWNEEIAEALASAEGIQKMGEEHWRIVHFLRKYYAEHNRAPLIRDLCKATQRSLKDIYDLFPSGPAAGACKIAGLRKPSGCV
jgi:TusE/DsrC/DsvC family sulfur relay protein